MSNKVGSGWFTICIISSTYAPLIVKGYAFVWNMASEGRMEFSPVRNRFTSEETNVVDYYV